MIETIDFIKSKIGEFKPEIGIVLGSGLGELADEVGGLHIPFCEIPNFEVSTIEGHKGQLVFAEFQGKKCVFMQGRFHFYEGHSIKKTTLPIKLMKSIGVETVILTNAAGGINTGFSAGDLMLISDHINLMGTNPLIGKNDDTMGVRFPDMSEVYPETLRAIAREEAKKLGIKLQEGVYAASTGPSYETPAEVRMLRLLGADACGMSTAPEAIVANYAGMKVLGISCITNMAAGIEAKKLSHSEVVETANLIKEKFKKLVSNIIEAINT